MRALARRLLLLLALSAPAGAAHAQSLTDVAARAAFAYNFAKYVEWPDEGPSAMVLCALTPDEAQMAAFLRLEGRQVQGQALRVLRPARPTESQACRVLFVGQGTERRLAEAHVAAVRGRPVLTVGDLPGFLDLGGMIELVPRDERLAFDVQLGAARRAGLRVSAQALRLAREVRE